MMILICDGFLRIDEKRVESGEKEREDGGEREGGGGRKPFEEGKVEEPLNKGKKMSSELGEDGMAEMVMIKMKREGKESENQANKTEEGNGVDLQNQNEMEKRKGEKGKQRVRLKINMWMRTRRDNAIRFWKIVIQLHLDVQMVISNRVFGLSADFIPFLDRESTFTSILSSFSSFFNSNPNSSSNSNPF